MSDNASPSSIPPVGPDDGPVAVTGSAGYIGSHIVKTLVDNGYSVRACVRDVGNLLNTAHLTAMNNVGPGNVTLHACDLTIPGAYNDVFDGCVAVFHAAAEMGNLEGSTPLKVYEGGLVVTRMLMDSIKKAGSIRRLVYTSSFAAVGHPADEGHRYTEDSWADMNQERRGPGSTWDMETVKKNREVAYAMTKVETERYVYEEADKNGFAAFGVCPLSCDRTIALGFPSTTMGVADAHRRHARRLRPSENVLEHRGRARRRRSATVDRGVSDKSERRQVQLGCS